MSPVRTRSVHTGPNPSTTISRGTVAHPSCLPFGHKSSHGGNRRLPLQCRRALGTPRYSTPFRIDLVMSLTLTLTRGDEVDGRSRTYGSLTVLDADGTSTKVL